jgi:nucleobase:cation symporter-1, NCS1 family
VLLAAVVVQTFAANLTNVYTAGLSLATSFPALGRLRATVVVGLAAVVLSGFPSLIEEAQSWITHLGNLAAPITGVVLADYLVLRRGRLDVPALYAPPAGTGILGRVDVVALVAVATGTIAYSVVPDSFVKVVWGAAVSAGTLLLARSLLPAGDRN